MDVTAGYCIIIQIYGVRQEWLTVLSGECGLTVEHGYASICGSIIYTLEIWLSLKNIMM